MDLSKAEAPVSLGELQAYPIHATKSILRVQKNRVSMLCVMWFGTEKRCCVKVGSPNS